jgi:nitrile hydratase
VHDDRHDDAHADPHAPIEEREAGGEFERRADAIQALLVEKGVLSADDIRRTVEEMDGRGEANGARLVARAWVDPAYRARLLADPHAAIREVGLDPGVVRIAVVENTDRVHHVICCTLCSCYPRAILGRPPAWYKSLRYRSRVVADPRGVLREFGLELAADVEVRVVDSTADLRYIVLPRRPGGTEGMSEVELAGLVTRDSLIGVAEARAPRRPGRAA